MQGRVYFSYITFSCGMISLVAVSKLKDVGVICLQRQVDQLSYYQPKMRWSNYAKSTATKLVSNIFKFIEENTLHEGEIDKNWTKEGVNQNDINEYILKLINK